MKREVHSGPAGRFTGAVSLAFRVLGRFVVPAVLVSFGFGTTAQATPAVVIEAEDGQLTGPFVKANNSISFAEGAGSTNSARATYTFTIPEAGGYALLVALSGNGPNKSLRISIDGDDSKPGGTWHFNPGTEFRTNAVVCVAEDAPAMTNRPTTFQLSQGAHKLVVKCDTPGVRIDKFELRGRPRAPTGVRIHVSKD